MKKFGMFICKYRITILIISAILMVLSFIGMILTPVNYDILVYLPKDIETIRGQNILTNDFEMGSYSTAVAYNLTSEELIELENKIKEVNGVNEVISLYDVVGTTIPLEFLPSDLTKHFHEENSDLLLITFAGSTSAEETLNAVKEIRNLTKGNILQGGMSSVVVDTMELSESEITIYIIIAVILCIIVLELSLDSYLVPILLLINIGAAILFNLGTNIFLGSISYITKALVAVLQLGVTTDFSIFLYHSYEDKKSKYEKRRDAMVEAIHETFVSVTGSSLTTIAGFLVLCTMSLTLGKDLGIVMAKGVFLGVVSVLTLFPSLLLVFDDLITKTRHKIIVPHFEKLNKFIIKAYIPIFIIFILLFFPMYKANNKVDIYYKLDKSLPAYLESIKTNEFLKNNYNIVSPEVILIDKNIHSDEVIELTKELENVEGMDFVLSFAKLENIGITRDMISEDFSKIIGNDKYQIILINSLYDIATDKLNEQVGVVNDIVKRYDKNAIVAGEGPLMKDLVTISNTDFNNVNFSSIAVIFLILFFVLKSLTLPFFLIAAIEFAIFTNLGYSYFSGVTLPFIAQIVLGTIQLGATIDYAILLTTTYLSKRKEGIEKKQAMLETLNYSGNSIFISGMCFFAATCGVGLYSKIEMIGSICNLISRGAIISMLVVIMILPSILLIFDKVILKTTLNSGEEKKMKKINSKKVLASLCLIGMTFNTFPVSYLAYTKDETVYSKLDYSGKTIKTLVNERIDNEDEENIIKDYTILTNIININTNSKKTGDKDIVWETNGKNILYQGLTEKELPVSLKVTYYLDGKKVNPEDILGKSGKIKIRFKYTNKDKHVVKINGKYETLYTPFMIALGTMLDSENNTNLKIENGKVTNNGNKYLIAGIASPGLYESLNVKDLKDMDKITITYNTTKFEMPEVYSVVTPKLIAMEDVNEVFDKIDEVYDDVNELQKNMNKIIKGVNKLVSGSNELKEAVSNAIEELRDEATVPALSSSQLDDAVSGALEKVDEGMPALKEAAWSSASTVVTPLLTQTLNNTKSAITAAYLGEATMTNYGACASELQAFQSDPSNGIGNNCKIVMVSSGIENIIDTLAKKAAVDYFTENSIAIPEKPVPADPENPTDEELAAIGAYQTFMNDTFKPVYNNAYNNYLPMAALMLKNELERAQAFSNATAGLSDPTAMTNAMKNLTYSVTEKVADGVTEEVAKSLAKKVANKVKKTALNNVADSMEDLYDGICKLDDGINELSTGMEKFNKKGINKITDLVNGDVKSSSMKIKKLMKLGDSYSNFAGKDKNAKGDTKFILVTDSLKVKEEKKIEQKEEIKSSFKDRVKELMR